MNNNKTWQVNFDASCNYELSLADAKYKLLQFHFHVLSEHNLGNNHFAAEVPFFIDTSLWAQSMQMHMVHANAAGELAVVGIMIGSLANYSGVAEINNKFLANVWPGLSSWEANHGGKASTLTVDPYKDMLPANPSYYHYPGSLTTPPCSEGVKWFVMASPVYASQSQIATLQSSLSLHNHRLIQPLNGRVVKFYAGIPAPAPLSVAAIKADPALAIAAVAVVLAVLLIIGQVYLCTRKPQYTKAATDEVEMAEKKKHAGEDTA